MLARTYVADKPYLSQKMDNDSPVWLRCLLLGDAVEKVDGIPAARNNRIVDADFLNRSCAFDARLKSKLLGQTLKILFRQHRALSSRA